MKRQPVLLLKKYSTLSAFFAVPITLKEYERIKDDTTRDEEIKKLFKIGDYSIDYTIHTFGSPINVRDNYFNEFVDEKLIKDRWHNNANFFTSNRLEEQDVNYRYLIQTTLSSKRFIEEILDFFEYDHVLIISTRIHNLKNNDKHYTTTHRLIRKGYVFKN